jgi:hypothetical protein
MSRYATVPATDYDPDVDNSLGAHSHSHSPSHDAH